MRTENLKSRTMRTLLVVALASICLLLPIVTDAMLIPADPSAAQDQPALQRHEDLQKIQGVLEAKIIRQRLEDLGFSADEISAKVKSLSDEQIHAVATQLDSLTVGGFHGATDDLIHLL